MATRFGQVFASFYARDALSTPLEDTQAIPVNYREPVAASGKWQRNGHGEGEASFPMDAYIGDLIQAGRVCTIYQYDRVSTLHLSVTPPFIIEKVQPYSTPQGDYVRISGPDLMAELKNVVTFAPIGTLTTVTSSLSAEAYGPSTTTLAASETANSNRITVQADAFSKFAEGDEIQLELDNASTFYTVVATLEPDEEANTVELRDRIPYAATSGNDVTRSARKITIASNTEVFQVGTEVHIGSFKTLVDEAPAEDIVTLRDAIDADIASGTTVTSKSYITPTTSDVTDILAKTAGHGANTLEDWAVTFQTGTGTQYGTQHAPAGDSLYDLLVATAESSGEFFRLYDPTNGYPQRTLIWRRTADSSGVRLVAPQKGLEMQDGGAGTTARNMSAYFDSAGAVISTRGLITGAVKREGLYQTATRIFPFAGDDRVNIVAAAASVKTEVNDMGYTIVEPTSDYLYAPAYLKSAARETAIGGILAVSQTFSEIKPRTDNAVEIQAASDELLRRAANYLNEHNAARYTYTVEGVILAKPVLPGQTIEMIYTDPNGTWEIPPNGDGTTAKTLYVLEVNHEYDAPRQEGDGMAGGLKVSTLILCDDKYGRPTAERATARSIVNGQRVARQQGGANRSGAIVVVGAGGGGGGGAPPATISATTPNSSGAAGETHQVLAVNNARVAPGQLLKATSAGGLTLSTIKADYLQLTDGDGEIGGALGTVRVYREIHDGVIYLVGETI